MFASNPFIVHLEAMKTVEQKAAQKKAKRERRKVREAEHKKEFFDLKAKEYSKVPQKQESSISDKILQRFRYTCRFWCKKLTF